MTDVELYALCKKWGAEALEARRKFIGLLPEVNERRLYERRKFLSIYHFAAALGGVGRRLVDDVLRLEKLFAEMPNLHTALVNGEIGLTKLGRLVSIVSVANEAEICEKIRTLSKRAVDVLVREMVEKVQNEKRLVKTENTMNVFGAEFGETQKSDGLLKPDFDHISPPGRRIFTVFANTKNHDFEILNALSPEVKMKLKELIDKEIDINSIILEALAGREAEIAQRKMEIVGAQIRQAKNAKCKVKNGRNRSGGTSGQFGDMSLNSVGEDLAVVGGLSGPSVSVNLPAPSRHIPVKIRRVLKLEFGTKCADSGCQNLSEHIHHEKPFAYYAEHDPRRMKPLCRGHHELEHAT